MGCGRSKPKVLKFCQVEIGEKARSIKGPDEIKAMRYASLACENAMSEMESRARALVRRDIW